MAYCLSLAEIQSRLGARGGSVIFAIDNSVSCHKNGFLTRCSPKTMFFFFFVLFLIFLMDIHRTCIVITL